MDLPFKLISTDFDGTLFAEFENPPIPKELQETLGQLQARGVKWAINTGRDMSSLMEALGRAGIAVEPDYLILVEREIHLHQESLYLGLEEWNQACVADHARVFEQVRRDLPRLVNWVNSRFHASIYEDAYSPFCLITSTNRDMDQVHAFLQEYCRTVPDLSVVRNDVYARFCHRAYNKGTALAEVARRLGLLPSQILAIGDHLNDLPMLSKQFAHFLAAPANAVQCVRTAVGDQGGYLCLRPQGWGVAEAIKHYLETHSGLT